MTHDRPIAMRLTSPKGAETAIYISERGTVNIWAMLPEGIRKVPSDAELKRDHDGNAFVQGFWPAIKFGIRDEDLAGVQDLFAAAAIIYETGGSEGDRPEMGWRLTEGGHRWDAA